MGSLLNSFSITNLDLENSRPSGFFILDTVTRYGSLTTGTPTTTANPGKSVNFLQKFLPRNTYLFNVPIKSNNSRLSKILDITNFDITHPGVDGGIPYKQDKDPTVYPRYTTGTPTPLSVPGAPGKFYQKYDPKYVYLERNEIIRRTTTPVGNLFVVSGGVLNLISTLSYTNLDVEDPKPNGGIPYKTYNDPTSYPKTTTGTPTTSANPGPFAKFNHVYNPKNTYLDTGAKGKLASTVANTNLDVEDPKPNGGIPYKTDKDPTVFPKYVSGTPTTSTNPGAPNKFNQVYNPKKVYVDDVTRTKSKLASTLRITNFDVENPGVNGGIPYRIDTDPTVYPTTNTGTPSNTANPASPTKFYQNFIPANTYLQYIKDLKNKSNLLNLDSGGDQPYTIFDATNLDVEKPGVDGGIPYKKEKDPTVYPITTQRVSSTRGFYPITGKEATKFDQIFNPTKTYEAFIKKYL